MEPNHFEQLYPVDTRSEEIKKMIDILKTGRSVQIVGFPGVGKSNVLRLLPYNKELREKHLGDDEPRFHFIYMDFSEIRERPLFDVMKFIFISLSYSLGERRLVEEQNTINDFLKEALSFKDELVLFQGLKKSVDYLAMEKGLHLVFLFDRFEEYIPNIDDKFFLNLRIMRNRVKYNFMAVFAVTRPIEEILETTIYSEFHEFIAGNIIYLPVKDSPGLAFRFSYLEKITGKKADDKIKKEVEDLTGGHGKLAKLAYEAVLAHEPAHEKHELSSREIREYLLSRTQIKGALLEIWRYLTPEEQDDIRKGEKNESLEKVNLLSDGKITIPLFGEFIKSLPSSGGEIKISYDAEKNDILKGQEVLSDKLTPSEFRLLRFLLNNKDKICEKDEIIENVWKDSKTQEGVTDQALDQVIYRLRKKIESDPNNPKFIQTIKGRGYKFNQ